MKNYVPWFPVSELKEIFEYDFFIWNDKVYHAGWVGAWSIRRIKQMIDRESLFIAVKSYGVRVGDSVMADSLYYPNQKEKVGVVFELGKRGAFVAFPNDKFRWFFMYEDLRKVSE